MKKSHSTKTNTNLENTTPSRRRQHGLQHPLPALQARHKGRPPRRQQDHQRHHLAHQRPLLAPAAQRRGHPPPGRHQGGPHQPQERDGAGPGMDQQRRPVHRQQRGEGEGVQKAADAGALLRRGEPVADAGGRGEAGAGAEPQELRRGAVQPGGWGHGSQHVLLGAAQGGHFEGVRGKRVVVHLSSRLLATSRETFIPFLDVSICRLWNTAP